jgi:hypothetical protein
MRGLNDLKPTQRPAWIDRLIDERRDCQPRDAVGPSKFADTNGTCFSPMEGLITKFRSQRVNSVGEKVVSEVFFLAVLVTASLDYLLLVIKTKAEHFVLLTANR